MNPGESALGVTDAMALAKGVLERLRLRVVGEVSGVTIKPGYKAIYFSLKDAQAVMPCLMWRDAYDASDIRLEDGQLVEARGFFSAYAPKGRLQFQVQSVTVAGEGVLRLQVAALARALEAEGLMSPARKRELPAFPDRIGIVTSPRGKAVHDILRTLRRRYPLAELVIAGVQVEGEGAIEEIVRGIELVGKQPGVDVVILGRGGGSYEDLMPFNSEAVARAVAACPVPVVTGIGHEPDTAIADMVADLRASTPTAAAEAVSPGAEEVMRRLDHQGRALGRALAQVADRCGHRLALISQRPVLRDARSLFAPRMQAIDLLAESLHGAIPRMLERQELQIDRCNEVLKRSGDHLLAPWESRLERSSERIIAAGPELVARGEQQLGLAAARLDTLSPLAILSRGYSVCYGSNGAVIRSAMTVSAGDRMNVRLSDGRLGCFIDTIEMEE